jgi:iron complex outermembrane receptor protein
VVVDGPLFKLPGGQARAAVGVEYTREKLESAIQQNTAANLALIPVGNLSHNIQAVFAELNFPLLGEGSGIHALTLSLSGRHDKYSDYGGTFNPKVGIDFAPWSWLNLRGNWGKSFQAPSLASTSALSPSFLINLGSARFLNPAVPALPGQTMVALSGVNEPLVPQTAKTYSAGFDLQTPFIEGLSLSATYYRVVFKDQIAILPIFDPAAYVQFPDLIAVQSSPLFTALYNKIIALASNPTVLTSIPLANIYAVTDGRQRNLSTTDVRGLDFSVRYHHDLSFGTLYASLGGNDIINFITKATNFAPTVNLTDTSSKLRISTTVGVKTGSFRTELTWMRQGGYDVVPTAINLNQSGLDAYNVFNFFGQYDFTGTGFTKDLAVTLNIDNVLDKDPPVYHGALPTSDGYGNGFTLGRLVRVGVNKKF